MNKKLYPGQQIRLRATFVDPDTRQPVDPPVVGMMVRKPNGTEAAMTVTKAAAGTYVGVYVIDVAGRWFYRIESESPGAAAIEGEFRVEPSNFS